MTLTDAEVAIAAALAGAEVVRRGYGREHVRHAKRGLDFATETDVEAERVILDVLRTHRASDAVRGEELGESPSTDAASRRWLVDPLCGTLNFAATTPLVAVNVALTLDGRVTAAAVADPVAGELSWTDGSGAFRRREGADERLIPRAVSGLVDVNADGPADRPFVGGQLVADPRFRARFGPRVISSTLAVAWVADGRRAGYVSDGSFRDNLHYAAGVALCEAAGCVVTDLRGDPLHTGPGLIIAADRAVHASLVALVGPHLDGLA
ncbi:inositol monophosphatase family protein [Microbacterium sp. HJ5]